MAERKSIQDLQQRLNSDQELKGNFLRDLSELLSKYGVSEPDISMSDSKSHDDDVAVIYTETGTTKTKTFIV